VNGTDLGFASASQIAARVMQRELTARQVTEEFLARIETLQPRLNCFTQILSDIAFQQAARVDDAIRSGRGAGPLAGVPVAVKDIVDVAGVTTTSASHRWLHRHAETDAVLAERLRRAGAILIGKTNLHECAFGVTNINPHYGPVRNPWDPTRIPGGSSGGSAAAVAAGLCAGAVGTDTGGSIRIPASLCGVAGIKPTYGLVPLDGVVPLAWTLDHAGPLARTVRDAALLLDVMAGTEGDDARSLVRALDAAGPPSGRGAGGTRVVRVGIPRKFFWERLEVEIETSATAALQTLRNLGASLRDVEVPYASYAGSAVSVILSAEATAFHEQHLRTHPAEYGEDVRTRLERGFFLSGTDYITALRAQGFLHREFLRAFEKADVLVMPTTQAAGSPIDDDPESASSTSLAMSVQLTRFTNPFNLTGFPALSLPCGFTKQGLPVGLQIVGRPRDEALVLRVGEAYESATEWHTRRPPLH
jgi:aspartyl-tRNA(Asn)/glutamyl-tRNA(Gln) amidotransferase subunit A